MTMSKQILASGINGLVGSKLAQVYDGQYVFDNLDTRDPVHPVDITDLDQVMAKFAAVKADFVVHLAAFTNVSAAWEQTGDKSGVAYDVNVNGTKNMVEACKQTGKHLIHISTAYVFDGENDGLYTETDKLSPIEWYGQTKAWAEEVVVNSDIDWTILRIDQPFRSDAFAKVDTAHRIINGLKENSLPPQFTNHWFGPTYIDDFVKVIDWVIRTGTTGLFNASSGEKWTDYDFAIAIKESQNLSGDINPGDLNAYLKKTKRPYQKNTALDCSKLINAIDFEFLPIKQALLQLN